MILSIFKASRRLRTASLSVALTMLTLGVSFMSPHEQMLSAAMASSGNISSHIGQLKTSSHARWIEVKLEDQQILAWEGDRVVYSSAISSGVADSPTREGSFEIQSMHVTTRMSGVDYDVDDVPYTMYYSGHYALHGAYWHDNFGTPMSHGCVNLSMETADWIFNWAHVGTPVIVH